MGALWKIATCCVVLSVKSVSHILFTVSFVKHILFDCIIILSWYEYLCVTTSIQSNRRKIMIFALSLCQVDDESYILSTWVPTQPSLHHYSYMKSKFYCYIWLWRLIINSIIQTELWKSWFFCTCFVKLKIFAYRHEFQLEQVFVMLEIRIFHIIICFFDWMAPISESGL